MKKLLTLGLLASSLATIASAQRQQHAIPTRSASAAFTAIQPQLKGTNLMSEYIYPASFGSGSACANSIGIYRVDSVGYYTGVNGFGDQEILMGYKLSDYGSALPTTVDTVEAFFGAKYQGSNGKVRAKVYAANASGTPTTLLGTSGDIAVSALDTTGLPTKFVLANPATLTSNLFFVSIDVSSLYATHDTVGLFSTDNACTSTVPTAAWTKEADGNFYAFSDATNNWGFSLDIAIFAHVTTTNLSVGSADHNSIGATAYPVPASGNVNIAFVGQDNGQTTIALTDIAGRVISTTKIATVKGTAYTVPFDVSTLSSGLYLAEIASGTSKSVLKVNVR